MHITISTWNTNDGQAQVDAFVPGHRVTGGRCTLTLRKDGATAQARHKAITTPTATSCGLITIARADLSPGTWTAVVRFSAPTASGKSTSSTIQVPA